jgi:hypothetical protein
MKGRRFSKKTQRKERLLTDFINHNHLDIIKNIPLERIKKKKSNKVIQKSNSNNKKKKKSNNKKKRFLPPQINNPIRGPILRK